MIFCREDRSEVLDAAIQLSAYREQHISKQNYEITIVEEIHIFAALTEKTKKNYISMRPVIELLPGKQTIILPLECIWKL